jgi:hypothetical protein
MRCASFGIIVEILQINPRRNGRSAFTDNVELRQVIVPYSFESSALLLCSMVHSLGLNPSVTEILFTTRMLFTRPSAVTTMQDMFQLTATFISSNH